MKISKIISILLLSFSSLLLLYLFYRSEFYYQGTSEGYLIYYFIAIVFIILSIISFFIKKETKKIFLTLLISTLFGLYIVEGYLVINKVIRSDTRTSLEVYKDLKKEDPSVVKSITPLQFIDETNQIIFPLSGISNRQTLFCNNDGYYAIYQSDRYGFNNPDTEWDKKQIEFLLIGDSHTHGYCVNEPDTIGGNLRKNTNEGGVLNLGQGGNGSLIEYAVLKEYLPLTNTKRVLWIYTEANDLSDLKKELNNKILLNYLNQQNFNQNLYLKQDEIDIKLNKKLLIEINNIKEQSELSKFFKLHYTRILTIERLFSDREIQVFIPEFKQIIKFSKNFVEQKGAKFYFVYIPDAARYHFSVDKKLFKYDKIIQIVEDLDIPIIDLHKELFQKHKDPLSMFPFSSVAHMNILGYRLLSETIFNKINELEN